MTVKHQKSERYPFELTRAGRLQLQKQRGATLHDADDRRKGGERARVKKQHAENKAGDVRGGGRKAAAMLLQILARQNERVGDLADQHDPRVHESALAGKDAAEADCERLQVVEEHEGVFAAAEELEGGVDQKVAHRKVDHRELGSGVGSVEGARLLFCCLQAEEEGYYRVKH